MGSIFTPAHRRSSSLKLAPKPPAEECQDGNTNIIFIPGSADSSEVSVHEGFFLSISFDSVLLVDALLGGSQFGCEVELTAAGVGYRVPRGLSCNYDYRLRL